MSLTKLYVDTDKLIQLVENRPALYMTEQPLYHNKIARRQLWDEVVVELFEGWEALSDVEKNLRVKEMQMRWKHVRDCFRREVAAQKTETRSGASTSKRKKYIYAEHLTFLLPAFAKRQTSSNLDDEVQETVDPANNNRTVTPTGTPTRPSTSSTTVTSPGTSSSTRTPPGTLSSTITPPSQSSQSDITRAAKRKKSNISYGDVQNMLSKLCDSVSSSREASQESSAKRAYAFEDSQEFAFYTGLIPTIMMVPEGHRQMLRMDFLQLLYKYLPQGNNVPNRPLMHPPQPFHQPPQSFSMPQSSTPNPYPYPFPYPSTSQAWDPSQNSFTDL
ncbi:uncharacterized protein LOC121397962 [Xenopus laevis]|uniref:Uncharacterized protein LOC121397962 n=1 Tax=Xenopus laevis TaxID=8355 RepID=A0A8J1LRR2_XENLA|nr:uncharacterized protein LOC121397962 [Xenopus laevis]